MSALTSLLVRDEVVSVRQIEDALERQVLEGGELDSALLELDLAPENVLNAYRAASFRLPAVARDEVMSSSAAVLSLITNEQAERHRIIPITHDATTVLVAAARPLSEASRDELSAMIGLQVECCIACEVRIAAALARFYDCPMPQRMAQLAARIEARDAGALPLVEPILETPISGLAAELFDGLDDSDELEQPPGAAPLEVEVLSDIDERVSLGHVVEVRPSSAAVPEHDPEPTPTRRSSGAPRGDTQRGVGRSSPAPEPVEPPPPAARPDELPAARAANDVLGPGRAMARAAATIRAKRTAVPQGPLTRELAEQLLEGAEDRDAVVDVFFRYARQYFDATALCSVREERVLGREVHNVPNLDDIRALSVSVARGSALEELQRTLQPRVGDLARKVEDLPLAEALRRTLCQPSALLPICVQRRVVALIYGDRGGEYFRLQDLAPLVELLPQVSRAFERIIRTRKVLGLSARARTLAHAAAELGHAATQLDVTAARPQDHAKAEALLRNARRALSALGVPRTAPPPPAAAPRVAASARTGRAEARPLDARALSGPFQSPAVSLLGGGSRDGSSIDPRAKTTIMEAVAGYEGDELRPPGRGRGDDLERIPTARLPAVTEPDEDAADEAGQAGEQAAPRPPAYLSKPPPGAGRYSSVREGEGDEPELGPDVDTRRLRNRGLSREPGPPRSSSADVEDAETSFGGLDSPPPERRVISTRPSKPPPGTGVYHQQDVMSEVISLPPTMAKRRSSQPMASKRSSHPPASSRTSQPAAARASQPPTGRRSPQPPSAAASDPAPGSSARRTSKRPAPAPDARPDDTQPSRGADPPAGRVSSAAREATVIVDTLGQARGLVDDLCNCGPDDEGPIVQSLLRVGEEAIQLLLERFPGPLWFDRRRPYSRLPFGRDAGPIPRALAAFGEVALLRLRPLLRSANPDVRYYSTLFVTDQVHPEMLGPLAERLFDEDPQIRLMVREALPSYRHQPGFAQLLGGLRTRILESRAPVPSRLAAIDAAAHLRDGASVPVLVELLAHVDRQLSVPAHRALVAITCQDFGTSAKKWRAWYEENQHRHRVQWLIDSLMHGEQNLRSAAGIELQKVTQVYYGYVASAPKKDRERAQKRYQDWWDIEGRKRM